MSTEVNLELQEGGSFRQRVRWRGTDHVYVAISGMTRNGPVRVQTAAAHNIPPGWQVAVVSAGGLTELNAKTNPPAKADYRIAKVISPTEIEFNSVSGVAFGDYTTGGYLQFFAPMPLAGTEPRWVVKDKLDGTILIEATVANGKLTINALDLYYDINLDIADTEGLSWKKGLHSLESRDPAIPFTYKVIHGKIVVVQELATPV